MIDGPVTARIEADDGVRLHALDWRPGAVRGCDVLLVHGLASNALLWSHVASRLRASGHRVVAVDQRSHGRSDPSDDLGWARLTADLLAVSAALDLDRPLVVGQSWGGNVALELAARHPGAVRGIAGIDGGAIELAASFPDWEACWAALAPPTWERVRWDDVEGSIRARMAGWPAGSAEAALANLVRRPDGTVRAILPRQRHEQVLRALWGQRPSERWAEVDVPVLLVAAYDGGSGDLPKREGLEIARSRADRLRVRAFDGADHDIHLQRPAAVAEVLLGALADGFYPSRARA